VTNKYLCKKKIMGRRKKVLPFLENVEITGAGAEGKAVARVNERVLFVPFAAPGCTGL
jgi:23S rRNA (uracil1939-C5)-methyltransferase